MTGLLQLSADDMMASGDADAGLHRELRLAYWLIGFFFIVFLGGAALVPMDSAVVTEGRIVVAGNRQTVAHREGGTVESLEVHEGQKVRQGELLLSLRTTELRADYESSNGQLIEAEATRARLIAERGGGKAERPRRWATLDATELEAANRVLQRQMGELGSRRANDEAQRSILAQRAEQTRSRIDGLREQISAVERQSALIADEIATVQELADKGLAPLTRLRALQRNQAELEGRRGDLQAQIRTAEESIGESRMQGLTVDSRRQESASADLRTVETQIATLEPRVASLKAQIRSAQLRAPVSGTVIGLTAFTVGGVIRPGDRVMDIVPANPELVIETKVNPEDADDLVAGMAAEVRFRGVHSRSLPLIMGKVEQVTPDVFVDEKSGGSFYLARVKVGADAFAAITASRPDTPTIFKAGLPAEAIIRLRPRSALQYLTEPLFQSVNRAFREH